MQEHYTQSFQKICREMKYISVALVAVFSVYLVSAAEHWTYNNVGEWPGVCQTGTQQSPIDLISEEAVDKIFSAFNFTNYDAYNNATATNNGHSVTIYLHANETPTLSGGGLIGQYVFDHLHFHWQSEHNVDGYRYPLEMHMVHYSSKYSNLSQAAEYPSGVAVLSILFDLSIDDDEDFIPLIEVMDKIEEHPGTETDLVRMIAAKSFLPRNTGDYYRYTGSLTTPNCNEGVIWTVFTSTLPISSDQMEHFEAVWSEEGPLTLNYRPLQPLNGRVIAIRSIPKPRKGSGSMIVSSFMTILIIAMVPLASTTLL